MTFLTTNPIIQRVVIKTAAELAAPTAVMLNDYTAMYQLDQEPYTRYLSDGTTLNVSTMTTAEVDAIIAANDELGAMAPAVQTLIDAASVTDKSRSGHTGTDPAGSVVFTDGVLLETWRQQVNAALAGFGSSAPTIDTSPTISDTTPAVAQTLTVTPGTITGTTTETYFWSANGVPVTAYTSSVTYVVQAADAGQVLTVTQRSTTATGLYAERTSAATTAVAATVPTNSVAPTITPTGSQAVGTTYSVASLGTWADDASATVEYQWILNDADITGATATTYISVLGQEGGTIKLRVRKTTTQGSSAWVTSSNSSTVSGAATLTNTAVPAFPATLTAGTAATITNATWSGGTPSFINTRVYIAEGTGGLTTPYATITVNPTVYTPETDARAGLSTLVGATAYCDQQWLFNGVTYTSPKSAAEVIQAVSATLAARTDTASMSFTQNQAITPVRPVTGTGGTSPYTYAISPVLPSGLALTASGGSAGYISGTPTVTSAQTNYTITVTDSVAAIAQAVVSVTVSAQSVTALSHAFQVQPYYNLEAPIDGSGTDYAAGSGSNGASIPPISNVATRTRGGIVRLGPTTKDGLPAFRHAVYSGDPLRNGGNRAEISYDPIGLEHGVDYWFSFAFILDSDWTYANGGGSSDDQSIFQIHQEGGVLGTNTLGLSWDGATNGQEMRVFTANPGDFAQYPFQTSMAANVWTRIIIHARIGATAGLNPNLEMWKAVSGGSFSQLTNLIGASTVFGETSPSQPDFCKIGIYKWSSGVYGSTTKRGMYTSGLFFGEQTGASLYSEAEAAVAPWANL